MEFIKQFLFSILPLVLIFAIPLIAILSYRLIRRKLGSARGVKTVSPEIENITINPKYYNWLSCSLIGSFILFGWFIYAKGGDTRQFIVLIINWGVACFINVIFGSIIISLIAKSIKRNWRNAFLCTSAIMIFIQACITIAQAPK